MRTVEFKESELREIYTKLNRYNDTHRLTKHTDTYWDAFDKIHDTLYDYTFPEIKIYVRGGNVVSVDNPTLANVKIIDYDNET